MQPLRRIEARACPLPVANIDTDQLIPARFMSRPRSTGYGGFLLHDLRRDAAGALRADLAINTPAFAGARVLVTRRNFGCGSSREAAVYALVDAGFRVVLAPSFGDIFSGNAVNNGLLPARVGEADCEALLALLADGPAEIVVDLEAQTVSVGSRALGFVVDPIHRTKLLNGWDDLALTASYAAHIEAWRRADTIARPWMAPSRGD